MTGLDLTSLGGRGIELYKGMINYIDHNNNQLCHQGIDPQIPAKKYFQAE
jgi:hypothetical protein